jgi:pre-rRNA-processing protein TSR1
LNLILARRLGGGHGAPKIIGIIGLADNANTAAIRSMLSSAGDGGIAYNSPLGTDGGVCKPITVKFATHKQRFTIVESTRDITCVIDVAKVADILVFVTSVADGTDGCVDEFGDAAMSAVRAQGVPTVVGFVHGLEGLTAKAKSDSRRYATRLFETEFGTDTKVVEEGNAATLVRTLAVIKAKDIHYRGQRSYMVSTCTIYFFFLFRSYCNCVTHSIFVIFFLLLQLGDKVEVSDVDTESNTATLKVSGYLRGRSLNVHQLVHITGAGTYQLRVIEGPEDPMPLKSTHGEGVKETKVLAVATEEEMTPLDASPEEDFNDGGEQTWPTEDEMALSSNKKDGDDIGAAWLEAVSDDEDGPKGMEEDEEEEEEDDGHDFDETDGDKLASRKKQEKEHLDFPDEVAVPEDMPARVRFARYRGMQSFRTSPWDPKESLPLSYKKIFQFENFSRTQKDVVAEGEEIEKRMMNLTSNIIKASRSSSSHGGGKSVATGMDIEGGSVKAADLSTHLQDMIELPEGVVLPSIYVTLSITGVSLDWMKNRSPASPVIVSSLLEHEQRLSVLHFTVQKQESFQDPVKSKDPLDFHVGFRRFPCRPVYSLNNLNCDKHKFERFLNHGGFYVASVFLPICYTPCPVLMFKAGGDAAMDKLVACGSLLSVDPDRIVLKRIVLTGAPHKVKKRKAVVRDMFYDPNDIKWFKPVEISTKFGLTGHIKEPLGTHGAMKCHFNKIIKQHDTVCMTLYKRIYPKFIDEE